jgi:hypothetical protein
LVFLAGLGNTTHVLDVFAPRFRDRTELAHGTVVELPGANHYVFVSHAD